MFRISENLCNIVFLFNLKDTLELYNLFILQYLLIIGFAWLSYYRYFFTCNLAHSYLLFNLNMANAKARVLPFQVLKDGFDRITEVWINMPAGLENARHLTALNNGGKRKNHQSDVVFNLRPWTHWRGQILQSPTQRLLSAHINPQLPQP